MNSNAIDASFGEFLAFLRKRVGLTQSELGRAVGYSREQITRLENNRRAPDVAVIAARFVSALQLQKDTISAARLLELAKGATGEAHGDSTQGTRAAFNNVPAPLLPIVGRETERANLMMRLQGREARLVTVTGAAGVGKTRLAIEIANELAATFQNGACFVSLAAVTDAARVSDAILQTLMPSGTATGDARAALREQLRNRELLLVLDNFEQVVDAAVAVSEILESAPRVKIMVTSRTALELYGEFHFPLAPLPLPSLAALPSPEGLREIPCIELFIARAEQAQPGFRMTTENAPDVAALCVQLDGLPLAIELAAAQLRQISLRELRAGLAQRAIELKFAARNIPERHHSLTNALAWSYDHLAEEERRVFEWLGVFAGGATAEMLNTMRGTEDASEMLKRLVGINLVQARAANGETRYTLFETVRDYAREKLELRGTLNEAELKHAEYFMALAERAEPELTGAAQQQWMERLVGERDNFRRALEGSLGNGYGQQMPLRFCNALWKFWRYRCDLAEGYGWTTRALDSAADASNDINNIALRAGAEWGAGVLASVMQRQAASIAHLEKSLRLWETVEDDMGVAAALTALGARRMELKEFDEAVRLQTQALELYRGIGDDAAMAYAHNALGETWRAAGDFAASTRHYEQSLDYARASGHERSIAVAQSNLASVALVMGDASGARRHLLASLPIFRALADRVNIASCMATLGCVEVQLGEPERAAQLFGFADMLLREAGGKYEAADGAEIERWEGECRGRLGEEGYREARGVGEGFTVGDALALLETDGDAS